MKLSTPEQQRLFLEYLVVFFAIPLLVWLLPSDFLKTLFYWLIPVDVYWLVPFLILFSITTFWLLRSTEPKRMIFWSTSELKTERDMISVILHRSIAVLFLLVVITLVFYPERWLAFPTAKPWLFLMVILLYPLLSVYPQEVVFRAFFFRRYAKLFDKPEHMILANASAFAWLHIVFENMMALVLSFLAGALFAATYQRTRSMRLVCLEHFIYSRVLIGEFKTPVVHFIEIVANAVSFR